MVNDTTAQSGAVLASGLRFGQVLYDEDGAPVGHIRGFDEHGCYLTVEEGVGMADAPPGDHASVGHEGEAELMWRCWACGAVGRIARLPEECPDCGASKEELYYWTED
ncbi:DUF7130 family rubredoxin-like protein [Halomarina litorea]|uniref:DUF7130 family rubredoxin-like protein n=1 Tax=Halomarina litorea TaxID=2961595 RepID=UPI0020C48D72|nr:hypothetical protein [Halomarina sp. BCD28]